MNLSELLYPHEYTGHESASCITFSNLVFDTRRWVADCVFVALRGRHADPLSILAESGLLPNAIILEKGRTLPSSLSNIPAFYVEEPEETLACLYSRMYGSPEKGMTVIGVTGTAGKSSTAELLYRILRRAGYHTGLIGSIHCLCDDTELPLPERAEALTTPEADVLYPLFSELRARGTRYVVMEVSSQALALGRCAPIRFSIAVFTNLFPEHLDFHGSMEAYFEAKAKLFLKADRAVINIDTSYGRRLAARLGRQARTVGSSEGAMYRALSPLSSDEGVFYTLSENKRETPIFVPIPGMFTVANSLLAFTAASLLSVPSDVIAGALSETRMILGRMEKLELCEYGCNFHIIIDYAHTGSSLQALLKTVKEMTYRRLILLFGCGGDRDPQKRRVMGRIAEEYADLIILTGDNSRSEKTNAILSEILSGMTGKKHTLVIPDREVAIHRAIDEAGTGDLILLVGKGHETYEICETGFRVFDERQVVREYLSLRKEGRTLENQTRPSD